MREDNAQSRALPGRVNVREVRRWGLNRSVESSPSSFRDLDALVN